MISLGIVCFGICNIVRSKRIKDVEKCDKQLRRHGIVMIILGSLPVLICIACYIYHCIYRKVPLNEAIQERVKSVLDDVDLSPRKLLETISIFQHSSPTSLSPIIQNKDSISLLTPSLSSISSELQPLNVKD
jgi:hypothetical protein